MASNATAVDGGQVPAESPLITELREELKTAKQNANQYRELFEITREQLGAAESQERDLKHERENLRQFLLFKETMLQKRQNECSATTTALTAANKEKEELKKEVKRLKKEIETLELHNPKPAKKAEPKHDSNEERTPKDNKPRWGRDYIFFKPSETAELLAALNDLT